MSIEFKLTLSRAAARRLLDSLSTFDGHGLTLLRGRFTAETVQLHFQVVGDPGCPGNSLGEDREDSRPLAS